MIDINTKSTETCKKMEKLDTSLAQFTTLDLSAHSINDYETAEGIGSSTISTIMPITNDDEIDIDGFEIEDVTTVEVSFDDIQGGTTEINADDFFN